MNLQHLLLFDEEPVTLNPKVNFIEKYHFEIMMGLMFLLGAVFILACFVLVPTSGVDFNAL